MAWIASNMAAAISSSIPQTGKATREKQRTTLIHAAIVPALAMTLGMSAVQLMPAF